jgi:hypothetical protein
LARVVIWWFWSLRSFNHTFFFSSTRLVGWLRVNSNFHSFIEDIVVTMAFVVEDDGAETFGGGRDAYDIDLSAPPAPAPPRKAQKAASGARSGSVAPAGASVADKTQYYLSKLKANKAKASAATAAAATSRSPP